MINFMQERRGLLHSAAAWIVGGAALATTRPARAWEMRQMRPTSPLGRAYANHCGGPTNHAWLVAELQAELANDPSARSLSATCPLCGCPIIVSR